MKSTFEARRKMQAGLAKKRQINQGEKIEASIRRRLSKQVTEDKLDQLDRYIIPTLFLWDNPEIEWNGIAWWKSRKLHLRQFWQCNFQLFQLVICHIKSRDVYSQWSSLEWKPHPVMWELCQAYSSCLLAVRAIEKWFRWWHFDDFYCTCTRSEGILNRGVVTAVNIDFHNDMLQSLHRWPQRVGEAGPNNS